MSRRENRNRMLVFAEGGVWCVRHLGPGGVRVRKAFGTDTLPTPFRSAGCSGSDVVRELEARNPGTRVLLRAGGGR